MLIQVPECPECELIGQGSRVRFRGNGTGILGISRFKDELGHHCHNPNILWVIFSCNKGHKWRVDYKERCPNPNCNYNH